MKDEVESLVKRKEIEAGFKAFLILMSNTFLPRQKFRFWASHIVEQWPDVPSRGNEGVDKQVRSSMSLDESPCSA